AAAGALSARAPRCGTPQASSSSRQLWSWSAAVWWILMFFFQLNGSRDAFWTYFAAYLVLLTPGKTPRSLAAARVGSTVFGVLLLAAAPLIVPNQVLFSLGLVILLSGVGLSPAYPVIGGGFTTIGSVLLAGAPAGAIGTWSTHRLLDTVVGCAIALV